uniref:Complement C1q tumor necrosis factor-related protein 4-like n=1 Tax=Saccoglossus kowalevskii TaxID=10224 RepID=A0ABM0LZR4_SACKO|nr:PREDICTED: complement C1q tumor necrosis factor-related protein 4-like [Saccoglossus kowalevskii]
MSMLLDLTKVSNIYITTRIINTDDPININVTGPDLVKRKCAFSAARSTVMLGSLESQVITYDKLMANKGKSFDRNTGIFTAQTPGIYYFSFNVRSYDGKHIGITLMKNEETTTAIATDAGDRKVAQSQSIMLQLEVGDRVWLQLGPHKEYAIYSNSFNYVTFNGFLIYANFR